MAEGRDTVLFQRTAQLVDKQSSLDGTFIISHQNVHWKPSTAGSAQDINLSPTGIANQQRAKRKPVLRLVPHHGSPMIFQFASETERDEALDILAPLISSTASSQQPSSGSPRKRSAAAGSASSSSKSHPAGPSGPDAKLKEKLLADNKDLKALYDELMRLGAVSDAEFWATRQHLLSRTRSTDTKSQRKGLGSTMLTDLGSSDGTTNRVKLHITPEMVLQIFAEKPEVHKCYLDNVPHIMSNEEFWKKYGRYEWARRMKQLNKRGTQVHLSVEDQENLEMFERYRRSGEAERETRRQARRALPVVNLAADDYDALTGRGTGFGTAFNGGREGQLGLSESTAASDIIRDVNSHAAVVLDGIDAAPSEDVGQVAAALAKMGRSKAEAKSSDWDQENHRRWAETSRREARSLTDLGGNASAEAEQLNIEDPRRYFLGADSRKGSEGRAAAAEEVAVRGVGALLEGMDFR
mmetsp:Transcript_11078/g.26271  ORF Transcript_11078/g.26271 Transcript_11078/m.26271 type:complete len:467 (+) Transcript_11078:116-1516(+)